MPFVTHRGRRIHYDVRGEGPTFVLLHGLFSRGDRFVANGWVDALAGSGHRVVTIDSLGHGDSDKPHVRALYGQEPRAADVIAVLDAIGVDEAHVVGYSMGAWLALAVARFHPSRVASLAIGGWDPVAGPAVADFDVVFTNVRARLPELVAWVTPDVVPAVRASFDALADREGSLEALAAIAALGRRVLLFCGEADPAHDRMRSLGHPFVSVAGDHATALLAFDVGNLSVARSGIPR